MDGASGMQFTVRRSGRLVVALAAGAALLIGCSGAADDAPSSTQSPEVTTTTAEAVLQPSEAPTEATDAALVLVKGFLFQPDAIEVPAGATVTWENSDQILHTATAGTPDAPSGLFDGQMDGVGTSFTHTFDTPGKFVFFCTRHLHMRGEVTVR